MKEEYIERIIEKLNKCTDIMLLDLILQILTKA